VNREEILEYIRSERERALTRDTQQGFTQWAVTAGLLYVIFEFVSVAASLPTFGTEWAVAFRYYSQSQFALMAAYVLVSPDKRLGPTRTFENRINGPFTSAPIWKIATRVCMIVVLPAVCSHVAMQRAVPGSLLAMQLTVNTWAAWGFLLLIATSFALDKLSFWLTKFPSPPIPHSLGRSQGFANGIGNLLTLEILVGNTILVLASVPGSNATEIAIARTAFAGALFILGFLMLWNLRTAEVRVDAFDALERDILFHDVCVDDAKKRIADEYLGHEMGDWLRARLYSLKLTAENLISMAKDADKAMIDIESINVTYTAERKSRLNNYLKKIETTFDEYDKECDKLLKWLKLAQGFNRFTLNIQYSRTLNGAIENLHAMNAEACSASRTVIARVKMFIESLPQGSP
jgi:hypothetical protein